MTPHPALALIELFLRYWDGALTPAEADGLEQRLATDPTARVVPDDRASSGRRR